MKSKIMTLGILTSVFALAASPASTQVVLPEVEPYEVGEARPPVEPGTPILEMTLEDAINRALESNLGIQTARLNPKVQGLALRQAGAAYTPTFSTSFGFNRSTRQSTSQLDGGSSTTTETFTFNSGIDQPMPWLGGQLSGDFNNTRNMTNNSFATLNPSFNSNVSFQLTQPLLAGLTIDTERAALQTQAIQTQIAELQLEDEVAAITNQVREAYWTLLATIEQIEIQRRALAQSQEQLEQNRIRLQAGQGTQFEVIQTEAQVASDEQALLNAEIQWQNQELALKQLLADGARDEILRQVIIPVELPQVVDQEVDIDAATSRALETRLDLRQQRQQIDISEVNLAVDKSNSLPDVSLTASYSLQGVGGDLLQRSGLGDSTQVTVVQPGGLTDGLGSILDFDAPTWGFTLSGSYPIGPNPNRLSHEQAKVELQQQNLDLRTQELAIVTQVTSAGLAVRNTFLQYQAAQRNADASEQNLRSELARYEVGVATNFEAVQAQNQLTTARLQELQALIDHANAIADFERIQITGN
ncbi:MAG: TolC family protein [Longimicrobiales bacterium]|nr:TolC family protein [Longimicrobiales bacterium]